MFCLLVVLVKLSVLDKRLSRKTPLRKPKRDKGIVSRKPRPKSACDFLGLLYYFIILLHCALSLAAQCIVIGPVCGRRAVSEQPARAQCLRLCEHFFIIYLCYLLLLHDIIIVQLLWRDIAYLC